MRQTREQYHATSNGPIQQRSHGRSNPSVGRILGLQQSARNRATRGLLREALPEAEAQRCGSRTVELPTPGAPGVMKTLVEGPQAQDGIIYVTNVGDCTIALNGGVEGEKMGGSTVLKPGDYLFKYVPPAGATKIVAAAWVGETGRAAIAFDPCAGIS